MDLDPGNPASAMLHAGAGPVSPIALERSEPGAAPLAFVSLAVALCLLVLVVGLFAGGGDEVAAETNWASSFTGLADVSLEAGRIASAVGASLAVGAAAVLGRRLTHSWVAGLLCAALLALDPAILAAGMLAIPNTLVLAALLWALAFALSDRPALHWLTAASLTLAALLEPVSLLWSLPLAAILVLRGHIYAAPSHLGIAIVQTVVLPGLGALGHWAIDGAWNSTPDCLSATRMDLLLLRFTAQAGPSTVVLHGPVTWLVGAGVLLLVGAGALGVVLLRFRMARAPGRLQLRLVVPFHPFLSRGLWLLLLAAFAPTPLVWVTLFALALALGTLELADDAPGFGLAIGLVLIAFAVVVLVRAWGAVTGTGGTDGVADALALVPWTRASGC